MFTLEGKVSILPTEDRLVIFHFDHILDPKVAFLMEILSLLADPKWRRWLQYSCVVRSGLGYLLFSIAT